MQSLRVKPSIACIGEAMIELSLGRDDPSTARIGFAGDTLNTAIYLKRAAVAALDVSYLSVLGTDPFSAQMRRFIAAEGVLTAGIGTSRDKLPGIYSISTDENGERSFSYWRQDSAARTLFAPGSGTSLDQLAAYNAVYLSAITLAILPRPVRTALLDHLDMLRASGVIRLAFDSNWRPRLWQNIGQAREAVARAWSLTDIALPSLDDEMALFGDANEAETLARFARNCPGTGALKRGSKGPLPIGGDCALPAFAPVENPVDTTAAGDSFNGAFVAAMLRGKGLGQAMLDGHAYASAVITHRGAIIAANAMPALG